MRHVTILSAVGLLSLAACQKQEASQTEEAAQARAEAQTATEPAVAEPAKTAPEQAYLTYIVAVRREPNDARKITDASGKKVSNWVATLYRGEEVTVLEVQDDWAHIRTTDDNEGWLKKDGLLPVEGVTVATVFEEAQTFNRPDLVAVNSGRTVEAGTLLFVLKTKDQFSEVNSYGSNSVWVLSDKLNTDANEIAVSKLLNKVRWLRERKDPAADQVMQLARTQFASSKLLSVVEEADAAKAEAAENGEAAGKTDDAAAEPTQAPEE